MMGKASGRHPAQLDACSKGLVGEALRKRTVYREQGRRYGAPSGILPCSEGVRAQGSWGHGDRESQVGREERDP